MNERIKALRKELKLNQAEFGKKIGLSQRAVSEIEVGSNGLTQRNFDAICKTFGVNPEWLRDGVGEMFVETREAIIQSVQDEFNLTPDETTLIRTFLNLEPEQRRMTLKYIKNFAITLAAQMGVDYLQREQAPARRKPDSELTKDEVLELIGVEYDEVKAAEKRDTSTSLVSIGTSGTSKKFSIDA